MQRVVTLTLNPAVDKNCTTERVVADQKIRCDHVEFHPGGGGLNVARVIHELGGEAEALWTCGGAIGMLLDRLLDEGNIPHHPIQIAAMTRENLNVIEHSNERQYRFMMPGPELTESEIQDGIDTFLGIDPPPQYLVLSGSLPAGVDDDLYARIASTVPDHCRIVLDTSGDSLLAGIRGPIYLIKPNIRELSRLVDREITDPSQIEDVAKSLIRKYHVECIVTSLGSDGATMTTGDEHHHIRSPKVTVRSKVGAGDSMVGGMVYALSQGTSLLDSVRFGVAAGSAAVMTDGTMLCQRSDTERLYEKMTADHRKKAEVEAP